ncbi:uncharacterized protein LOC113305969 [Papaver somniferum]|uniref:uncharacterized protein LOC113305967 n=1 Tax=Papaver somniferum TaxID=3469 RepID=UPI000E6FF8B5|nr:uncharacterized protein LOC113305967 [Papaver somniferum]XP_026410744.1 uncharacterized protein LOC113305969 [Papaver somniferum]
MLKATYGFSGSALLPLLELLLLLVSASLLRVGNKRILCNLDRALFNLKWLETFNGWHYHVGARGVSDHGPLIGFDTIIPRATNIPFRFQKMWLNHPSFSQIVYFELGSLWDVNENLKKAEEKVIQTTLNSDKDPSSIPLLHKLVVSRGEYEVAANKYNIFLRDKARINWIKDGDINIKKFHTSIKLRQSQNSIVEIENSSEAFPDISEIKNVVFDLNQDGSPGPDGYTGAFYRKTWYIISSDLVEAITYCWRTKLIPSGMNSNFLVLIPKIKGAKNAKSFKPIGLSNFCFNIITKIITIRLSRFIHKVVSQQQYAFIKNRNIHEQVLLASELVNEISINRRGGNLGLKLDISQAYDTISWEFLYKTLKKFGFSASFYNWIMVLISSSKISIMLNGSPAGFLVWVED